MYDAIIIGGGASGLAAAVTAVKRGKNILIFESDKRVGRKLLAAGNGKCNISNVDMSNSRFNNGFVSRFLPNSYKVNEFFEDIGLKTRVIDGRVYPYSESGNTVLNLLRAALPDGTVVADSAVTEIKKYDGFFEINGKKCKKAVLATGSEATFGKASYDLAEKLGHKINAPTPVLCPLKTDVTDMKMLAGIRVKAVLTVVSDGKRLFSEYGEILFKDNGVSGIVAMNASGALINGKNNDLFIDFIPDMTENEAQEFLKKHSLEGILHRAVAESVVRQAERLNEPIFKVLKNFSVKNAKVSGVKYAQVMRGGLKTDEFSPTLESKICPSFYACGEVLDVDGACGGYNLHWAFLSGITVGEQL